MKTTADWIAEAKAVYFAAGLDCAEGLLQPAPQPVVDEIEARLTFPVPAELRAVFQVHGGQTMIGAGVTGLFGEHRLHKPSEVVENHEMFNEFYLLGRAPQFPPLPHEWGSWVPELLPFASWDAYDLCIHCHTGEVWEFIPNAGLIRHRPSIAALFEEVITSVQAGGEPRLGAMRGPP